MMMANLGLQNSYTAADTHTTFRQTFLYLKYGNFIAGSLYIWQISQTLSTAYSRDKYHFTARKINMFPPALRTRGPQSQDKHIL